MSEQVNEHAFEHTTKLTPITAAEFAEEQEQGLGPQDRAAIEALPAGSALLVVRKGPNMGARFLLDSDKTVAGRHSSSEIFLDDVTVSRKHAAFLREGDHFVVRDLGSLNGTYVAKERVDEARLESGQEVQIGKYRFTFHLRD
ncbi:MAG: FHA domain-containing protein [Dermabacter sp.]|nr:FHA domain-containing protein [Dermabacter sp.]